jgi:hypothetical protein
MSDFVGLICLSVIWLSGVAVGYFVCLVRQRGRPRLVFTKSNEVADETTAE